MKISKEVQEDVNRRMADMEATTKRIRETPDSVKQETAEHREAALRSIQPQQEERV